LKLFLTIDCSFEMYAPGPMFWFVPG
jgi:hypothetical protein